MARRHRREARIIDHVGPSDDFRERAPMRFEQYREKNMRVDAFKRVDRRAEQRSIPDSWRRMANRAECEVAIRLKQNRIHQRHINMLAFTCRIAMAQSRE